MDRRSDSIPNRHKGRKINPTTTNTKWIKSERYFISYACRKSAMSSNVCTFDRDGLIRLLQQRGLPESSITVVLHPLPINWSCGRVAYKNGWCIFHAEDKDPMDFDKALIQELNNMMKQNKYDFTGFVFPGIPDTLIKSLNTNAKPAYFIGATFKEDVEFNKIIFKELVCFDGAEFQKVVRFIEVIFLELASFRYSIFQDELRFERCYFKKDSLFLRATFNQKAFLTVQDSKKKHCSEELSSITTYCFSMLNLIRHHLPELNFKGSQILLELDSVQKLIFTEQNLKVQIS
jgi:hypothetical protein